MNPIKILALLSCLLGCSYPSRRDTGAAFFEEAQKEQVVFPKTFLFGTATAAHQIEGGNDKNDWARFESEPGRIKKGEKSGQAVDHWNRVDEDIELMKALNANAYRFSIEWSRLEPTEGTWDEAAWTHYSEELQKLKAANITPMVTLLHFTLPGWLAERGGATAKDFPEKFGRFAAEAATRLGSQVELWCTINEPNVQMYLGYVEGVFPPGKKSNEEAVKAFEGLLRAHDAAAKELRAKDAGSTLGVAMNLVYFQPYSRVSLLDRVASNTGRNAFNFAFYDSIMAGKIQLKAAGFPKLEKELASLKGSVDFFGVNYYRRSTVNFSLRAPGKVKVSVGAGPTNDLGWEIYPEGLYNLLMEVSEKYKLPIYITENGIADSKDEMRSDYLKGHLYAVSKAMKDGADIRGYFHWSLMDNFEWAEGFDPRFGLYTVDYKTMSRTPTKATEVFKAAAPKQ
jgi:beta-glucosidase